MTSPIPLTSSEQPTEFNLDNFLTAYKSMQLCRPGGEDPLALPTLSHFEKDISPLNLIHSDVDADEFKEARLDAIMVSILYGTLSDDCNNLTVKTPVSNSRALEVEMPIEKVFYYLDRMLKTSGYPPHVLWKNLIDAGGRHYEDLGGAYDVPPQFLLWKTLLYILINNENSSYAVKGRLFVEEYLAQQAELEARIEEDRSTA